MPAPDVGLLARASGVATHLIARSALDALADAPDLAGFVRGLARLGTAVAPVADERDVAAIERAIEQTADGHLRLLRRWQERAPGVLDVFDADQDRRSLRALLRGALHAMPADARLQGLLPTPLLPLRLLSELARQPSPAAIVGQLVLVKHPDAERLRPLVHRTQPNALKMDVALLAGFAGRATRAARRGDATLRAYVAERIDLGNALNALLLAGGHCPEGGTLLATPEGRTESGTEESAHLLSMFIAGGRWFTREAFVAAAQAGSQETALTQLTTALAASPLASIVPVVVRDVERLAQSHLIATLDRLAHAARVAPLSTAPLLRILLRIEAQSRDLRALCWGALLGTPPAMRRQQLVTPS